MSGTTNGGGTTTSTSTSTTPVDTTTPEAQSERILASIMGGIDATRDAISVRKVFGEPYELDGVTVIPVARVAGGGGGGGGAESDKGDKGSGFGTGFGLKATPVGVYEIRDGAVEWKPTVDTNRLAMGGQALAGLVTMCVAMLLWRRTR